MKVLALLVAGLALAGCTNMVMSDRPLFTDADAKGGPKFREGVWASPEAGCEVDLKSPLDTWPKCANGDVMGPDGPASQAASPFPIKIILAAGDPVVVQFGLPAQLREARAGLKDPAIPDSGYFYSALQPTERDAMGQVVAFEGWGVECGPPPPARKADDGTVVSRVTDKPLPGLKIVGDHCLATRAAAVRAAAAASRAWQTDVRVTRWIRAGER